MENTKTKKNILSIGRTGSGKSTLANILCNNEDSFESEGEFEEFFREGEFSISQTKRVREAEFKNKGERYRIIDTPGIGDTNLTDEEILREIAKACYKKESGF